MTVEYFNSLSFAEQEHLVLHEAKVVQATIENKTITLICELNNFKYCAYINLKDDRKSFKALGSKSEILNPFSKESMQEMNMN